MPLFNQKKRNRQPLTSNPLQNDPGISTVSDSYGSPPLPTGKKMSKVKISRGMNWDCRKLLGLSLQLVPAAFHCPDIEKTWLLLSIPAWEFELPCLRGWLSI